MAAYPRGPGPPKKTLDEHVKEQARFLGEDRPMRFTDAPKQGWIKRLFGG